MWCGGAGAHPCAPHSGRPTRCTRSRTRGSAGCRQPRLWADPVRIACAYRPPLGGPRGARRGPAHGGAHRARPHGCVRNDSCAVPVELVALPLPTRQSTGPAVGARELHHPTPFIVHTPRLCRGVLLHLQRLHSQPRVRAGCRHPCVHPRPCRGTLTRRTGTWCTKTYPWVRSTLCASALQRRTFAMHTHARLSTPAVGLTRPR